MKLFSVLALVVIGINAHWEKKLDQNELEANATQVRPSSNIKALIWFSNNSPAALTYAS